MAALMRIALAVGIVGILAQAAMAEDAELLVEPAPKHASGVVALLVEKLGDRRRSSGPQEKRDAEALTRFYEPFDRKPLWVGEDSVLKKAHDVATELKRAGDFGLEVSAFRLPQLDKTSPTKAELASAELLLSRAVLTYARHAKGSRVEPGKVGQQLHEPPPLLDPAAVLEAISRNDDPAAYLRSLHPKHPQFELLRKKYVALRDAKEKRAETRLPAGPVLRRGDKHNDVILLRKRLGVGATQEEGSTDAEEGRKADQRQFDDAVHKAVQRFQRENGLKVDGVVGAGTRKALNGDTSERQLLKLLVNMERWRWLPDDLDGDAGIYVWANIPEFRVRVVKAGEVAFSERVIVGKTYKQTPVFSDRMEWIELHPTWYVPNSIKVEDILPSLRRRTSKVMERYHLALNCGRHGRDPNNIDWSAVDIRNCSVSQPPGKRSVLGDFKFKFPNKHAVYMHDTPTRALFSRQTRTFSHGCVRIKNPRRMAEILLAHDKGMTSEQIGKVLAGPKRLHKEELNKHVPVHITYFTTAFDDKGKFVSRPDYYGHDRRLAQALTGKGHLLPAAQGPTRRKKARKRRATPRGQWWQQDAMQN